MQKENKLRAFGGMQNNSSLPKHISSASAQSLIKEVLRLSNTIAGLSVVVSLPSSIISDDNLLSNFVDNIKIISDCGASVIVVHDYEAILNEKLKEFGVSRRTKDLNMFDYKAMQVSEMIVSGLIRSSIISKFYTKNCKVLGLSGKDNKLIEAQSYEIFCSDMGINTVQASDSCGRSYVDPELLFHLADSSIVPVISPITSNRLGNTKLLNADSVAAMIAEAVGADHLVLFSDAQSVSGVSVTIDEISQIRQISKNSNESAANLDFTIGAAIYSLENDVDVVHFNKPQLHDSLIISLINALGQRHRRAAQTPQISSMDG